MFVLLIENAEYSQRDRAQHGDRGEQQIGPLCELVQEVGDEHSQHDSDQAGSDQQEPDSLAGLGRRQTVNPLVKRGTPGGIRAGRERHRGHARVLKTKVLVLNSSR